MKITIQSTIDPEQNKCVVSVKSDNEETASEAVRLFKMAMRGLTFADATVDKVQFESDLEDLALPA